MSTLITAVFVFTYVLIASRRLRLLPIGRPAGALFGAVTMVAIGAITPDESYRAIDHPTIVLLFSMMMLAIYVDEGGLFTRVEGWLVERAGTPWRLLVGVSLSSAVLSAFLLNDTICVVLTPIVVATCLRAKLPLGPYLMAVATSANIGSAATVVGNPQNILIGSMSGLGFREFSALAVVPTVLGLAVNLALLALYYRTGLPTTMSVAAPGARGPRGVPLGGWVLLAVIAAFFVGVDRAYAALAGVVAIMVLHRRDPREEMSRVDWPLLVFFCSLFIVTAAFAKTGFVELAWAKAAPLIGLDHAAGVAAFTALMTLGSNLVSNVPLVMLAGPYLGASGAGPEAWVMLGFVTTVAGNLTLVGSVANIIVAERAREHYDLGFAEYLRFGAVSTIAVLAVGVPALLAVAALMK
jgi:Na+/H+ antiporter NhaD/arsenite permease-like protein